jgi:hypothetical protein
MMRAGAVSVRSRDDGDLGSMPVDDLVARLKNEAAAQDGSRRKMPRGAMEARGAAPLLECRVAP